MSRRTPLPSGSSHTPIIAPGNLRDHADEARIDRIWGRLEHDLTGVEPAPARRGGVSFLLVAAAAGAFGGGLFVGKTVWQGDAPAAIPTIAVSDRSTTDVYATGSEPRSFLLPGGGKLELEAGATVEVERTGAGALTLRLVHGAASIDTAAAAEGALAIVAGEARLDTKPGAVVRVERQPDDHLGVRVDGGSVDLSSPDGDQKKLSSGMRETVRTRAIVAVAPTAERPRLPAPMLTASGPVSPIEVPVAVAAPPAANDWFAQYQAGNWDEALKLLQQGGVDVAIAQAKNAAELMAIADCGGQKGPVAIKAYQRVLERFPGDTNYVGIAARKLSEIYEKSDPELARKYLARATASQTVAGEDALCRQIRAVKNKEEAARLASEYVAKYPDGQCKDDADRLLHPDDIDDDGTDPPSAPSASSSKP